MRKFQLLLIILALIPIVLSGNNPLQKRTIKWKGIQKVDIYENEPVKMLRFTGSINEAKDDFLPSYFETFKLDMLTNSIDVDIHHAIYEPLTEEETNLINEATNIGLEIEITTAISYDRKEPYAIVSFIPIRKNEITGLYEKLIQFNIDILEAHGQAGQLPFKSTVYKSESVLSTGKWYKIGIQATGIYKLSYQDLSDMGIAVSGIDPKNIRLYGFKGGMLPENLDIFRYDDLQEMAIYVKGEDDGVLNSSDYVLFYGESPHTLKYSPDNKLLSKEIHFYSDNTYYYVTTDLGEGKRIPSKPSSQNPPNNIVTNFHDCIHYEIEETNLLNTGRNWWGETFDLYTNLEKEFSIDDLDKDSQINLQVKAAARSQSPSYFNFYVNGSQQIYLTIPGVNIANLNGDYAATKSDSANFHSSTNNISIEVTYSKPTSGSIGWLDYLILNFKRDLALNGGQTSFRHLSTALSEFVTEYTVSKSNSNTRVWDVTNSLNIKELQTTLSGTSIKFVSESDSIQEFIAFDGSSYLSASLVGPVENQNLHGEGHYDMVILTHPNFRTEADRLADFHRTADNMSVLVTEPSYVYNEFSAGSQDVTAIRDFMKLLYDNNGLKYLLLFGDGSFDPKDRMEDNTNFIPCWESFESLNPVESYVKDDFFGLLDGGNDLFIDIGIGRFVVNTLEQATAVVDKTIHYATNSDEVMGDWRNIICLVGDDEDSNLHFGDAEDLAGIIDTMNLAMNVDKIYLDAYQQVSTPSGERYPDVNLDINNRIERGALIVNYVGHGGEGGLAHERIMTINDINSWDNYNNMPVFVTATCEFSRFDDPERTSAGEFISLHSNGGGVALFTTTRATYAGGNYILNSNFYRFTLKRENGEYLRMGDINRKAKNASSGTSNKFKFMLLGDPAVRIAFPEHEVITAEINNVSIHESYDTIKALSEVTISGEIHDYDGNKLTDYNGTLYPTVFDKPSNFSTLGNDPASSSANFNVQKNALYKGKATIANGEWEFTFIAPKDIAYDYGFGKLSYYAKNESEDAHGCFNNIIIGGYNQAAQPDTKGPVVNLFMNDLEFKPGGLTDESPSLLAYLFDESGINTVGNGIGHDILATLDETETFVLNNYYESELDNYQNGSILYPFYSLDNGKHTLKLKVWDIHNNSTTVVTEFIVAESVDMALDELVNYPNPFIDFTTFSFEHNQVENPLDITIRIFSLDGRLVRTLNDIYNAGGYNYKSERWNGTNEDGTKLDHGMYVYKLTVKNQDGSMVDKTNKLVILR